MNAMGKDESVLKHSIQRLIKGTAVGFFASGLLQPLQVIKTSMQITPVDIDKKTRSGGSNISNGTTSSINQSATLKSQAAVLPDAKTMA